MQMELGGEGAPAVPLRSGAAVPPPYFFNGYGVPSRWV
jgi:hypothetical protein